MTPYCSSYCFCSIEGVGILAVIFAILIFAVKLSLESTKMMNKVLESDLKMLYVLLILAFIFAILNNIF